MVGASRSPTGRRRHARRRAAAAQDGELDGRFNLAERGWKDSLYGMIARANTVKASITPGQGPRIEVNAQMLVKE